MKKYVCLFILIIIPVFLTAQNMESWILANEKIPAEKIYLHTDAEHYFQNDTIWFKTYLADSRSGQLIPRAENIYVNLLNESGSPVYQSILLSVNGTVSGNISISDTLKPGNYLIQAFTGYLLNFNADAHFYKRITISRVAGISRSANIRSREENMVADVSFLPEGGVLLENMTNVVAFKAVSHEGFGVNAKGTVKDERGTTVTSFSTDYRGMGIFFLTPESGKTYTAQITGFSSFNYSFKPLKEGVKIQLVNHTSKEVIVNIAGNSEKTADETFYLVNMHRGEVIFYREFKMDGINKVMKFESSSLRDGINRMVLLDKNLVPVSERLLFSRPSKVNHLLVLPNSDSYPVRAEIKIQVADEKYTGENDLSNLSVSVINKEALPKNGISKNILSQFLIDSELNGFVESSADLFIDNDISSEAKLRLVMLTNGWSSYFWNGAPGKNEAVKYVQTAGLNLKGVASNPLTGKVIQNGEITLVLQKDGEMAFLTRNTGELGDFVFEGLLFKDTATVYVQAKSESGKLNTEVILDPLSKKAESPEAQIKLLKEKIEIPSALANLKYRENAGKRKSISPKRKDRSKENLDAKDEHFRLYKSADFVLEVDKNEQTFSNVIDFMAGKVPGLDISGNDVRIRGASSFGTSSSPLFLIDGVPLVSNNSFNLPAEVTRDDYSEDGVSKAEEQLIQSVKAIPMNDVEKIEILKSPTNLAVFGVKGANGVIAIYTRKGKQPEDKAVPKGVLEKRIMGYSEFRNFYSPQYLPGDHLENEPDIRATLYWNPEVITQNGNAEIRFFSSGETGKYKVFVEGITADGKICLGSAEFEVTE